MFINNEIVESHFDCNYKSYLKLEGQQGKKYNFEKYQLAEVRHAKNKFLSQVLKSSKHISNKITLEILKQGQNCIPNAETQYGNVKLCCDLIKRVTIKSELGNFAYIPVLVIPFEKIAKKFIILISGLVYILSKIQGSNVGYGEIIYTRKFKSIKIKTNKHLPQFLAVIDNILQRESVNFRLNSHCSMCEFSKACKEKAIKEDHLSLLKGMAPDTIRKLNNRGIFTINQLSYTFRPKRKSKTKVRNLVRSFALQALAIRENKIFVYDTPDPLPKAKAEMFLDIEGLPNDNFQYLIGLTIKTKDKIDHINFWSNDPDEELSKAREFLSTVLSYDDFFIYLLREITKQSFLENSTKNFLRVTRKELVKFLIILSISYPFYIRVYIFRLTVMG